MTDVIMLTSFAQIVWGTSFAYAKKAMPAQARQITKWLRNVKRDVNVKLLPSCVALLSTQDANGFSGM